MEIISSIKFVLSRSFKAAKPLLVLYIALQTIIGLSNTLYIFFYTVIIDLASGTKKFFGLTLISIIIIRFIYEIGATFLDKFKEYVWNVLDIRLALYNNQDFIHKLSTLDLPTYENPTKNDLIWRTLNRFQFQFKYYLQYFVDLIQKLVQFGVTIAIFLFGSPLVALFVVVAHIIPIIVRSRFGQATFLIYRADSDTRKKFETLQGVVCSRDTLPEIKLFHSFGFFKQQILALYRQFTNKQLKVFRTSWIVLSFVELLPVISIFVFLLVTANQLMAKQISTGIFVLLYINVFIFSSNLTQLMTSFGQLIADHGFMQDAVQFYNLKSTINFPILSKDKQLSLIKQLKHPVITFKNVSFSYPNSTNKKVLKDISFSIPYGQNIAIIGENGAGKTTMVKLLMRMYDPIEGNIFINDVNIKDIPEQILFLLYSTLFQSFGKFAFTIRQNLEMAAGKKLPDEEYIHALIMSNAWNFVKDFPHPLDQQLGPQFKNGVDLSGGQWQQLAIAKAYLKKGPIMILDEPTSHVDAKAEMEIFDRLNKETKENTVIFISHRFSTIKDAQRIVVLDKGSLIEDGTHEVLMKQKGKYATLYTSQAARYERQ